jgi:hypothetical protein
MILFHKRKNTNEVQRLIRRAMDVSAPKMVLEDCEERADSRVMRAMPVILAPWEDDRPKIDEHTIALTKDLSSLGLAVVLPQPFRAEEVVIGLLIEDQPFYVRAWVRHNVPLGGGFWQLGLELAQRVTPGDYPALMLIDPITARLRP